MGKLLELTEERLSKNRESYKILEPVGNPLIDFKKSQARLRRRIGRDRFDPLMEGERVSRHGSTRFELERWRRVQLKREIYGR